jgi:hypothetical protein
MSEHDERALAEAYALRALDAPERKLFEAHLADCKICREAVASAGAAAGAIALTAPPETPPAGSGDRLRALYQKGLASPPPASRGGNGTLALAFVLVALGISGWGYFEHERAEKAEERGAELAKLLADCENDRAILDAPDARTLSLVPQNGFNGSATIVYSPSKGVAVIAKSLPEPPAGKVYKLWYIAGAPPSPLGAFKPGIFFDRSPGGAETKFAVSLEDAPGNVTKPDLVVLMQG